MDRSNGFKINVDNENDAAIDLHEVNMDEFWERVELNIMPQAFFELHWNL